MNQKIPILFKLWSLLSFLLSCVSWWLFDYGIHTGFHLFGPFTILMLGIASSGLFITCLIAMWEWRRRKR